MSAFPNFPAAPATHCEQCRRPMPALERVGGREVCSRCEAVNARAWQYGIALVHEPLQAYEDREVCA